MKIEPRGKYAGVKVHLDGDEAKEILAYLQSSEKGVVGTITGTIITFPQKHVTKLGKKIKQLLVEEPKLLEDRTEEQIKAALAKDKQKIEQQQAAIEAGTSWKF